MRVLSIFTMLATAAAVYAQSAVVIVGQFQTITTLSSNLNDLTASLNIVNVLFKGPQVGQGLVQIANTVNQYMGQMQSPPPVFGDADARQIVAVLTTFVTIHQRLLNTIIGKHGLLSLFFFTEPVREALVELESVVDSFALALIAMIPTQAPAANQQFKSLDITIGGAITVYS